MMTFVHQAAESRPPAFAVTSPKPSLPPEVPGEPKTWGIITIQCVDFQPKGVRSRPPSIADCAGADVACIFAHAFNGSSFAKTRRRWALVSDSGSIVTLSDIADEDRPSDPSGFPPIVLSGLTKIEAMFMADDLNRPRFKLARIPRHWSIPVTQALEGGRQ